MTDGTAPFRTTVRVRYAETDQMGVVYYANYLVWFEIGRVEFLRQLGFDYKQMEVADDCMLPVVEAICRYKAPAQYDDLIVIETRVTAMRTSMLKFSYEVYRAETIDGTPVAGKLLASGETSHVIVGYGMQKTVLPEKYASVIRATLGPLVDEENLPTIPGVD
ncbi:4-hydroxybenzoyl-CoA thioesterase family active site [Acidisarcina polymorpha]|uniref:4-hydroxybenzoyl-CoA thioesterase family active site n=1 Tax=Acidisarcina polymorpha TaxID=2211140 RepID=A0A2Z5FSL5_9BACT|nr:thioesterase family protein [Acidisarcina polymorpha]AXC09810.1 4-hydroxybenzoyl-CoA thioesterase family active site [Acidisarcina polymorpha]